MWLIQKFKSHLQDSFHGIKQVSIHEAVDERVCDGAYVVTIKNNNVIGDQAVSHEESWAESGNKHHANCAHDRCHSAVSLKGRGNGGTEYYLTFQFNILGRICQHVSSA